MSGALTELDGMRYVLRCMSTQKRPLKTKPFASTQKHAGGKLGTAFRKKLEELIQETGSVRAFARKLREGNASHTDYSPRVIEWRNGRNLPSFETLQLIGKQFDVSVDWLLGFPVPRRRTHREPIGDLAGALLQHIVYDYGQRTKRERRDGLANVLGGKLTDAPIPRPKRSSDPWPETPAIGTALPDGRIVTHYTMSALRVLDVDPQNVLERICKQIFNAAEKWEEEHKEVEREAVRAAVREIAQDIETAIEASGESREMIYRRLLSAALDPLEAKAQAGLIVLRDNWRDEKRRKQGWDEYTEQLLSKTLKDMGIESPPRKEGHHE
jgi:hypothetical protein